MFDESDLLKNVHKTCSDVQKLALNTVHNIEMPICNFLTELTSNDCIYLMINKFDNLSNINQPLIEVLLQSYLITDYICCGLSSPHFHSIFIKTLLSDKKKIKLIKKLLQIWNYLLKNYEISSQNVEFVKHFIVNLENVICKISKSVVDDNIQIVCKKLIDKIKYDIQKYEQSILEKKPIKLQKTKNKRSLDIEYTLPEKSNKSKLKAISIENSIQPTKQKKLIFQSTTCNILNNKECDVYDGCQKYISDQNLLKKPKLMSDVENIVLQESNRLVSDRTLIKPMEPKLNAFQVLMLSAKKRKTKK